VRSLTDSAAAASFAEINNLDSTEAAAEAN
jgi:hypothetical protein